MMKAHQTSSAQKQAAYVAGRAAWKREIGMSSDGVWHIVEPSKASPKRAEDFIRLSREDAE